MAAAATIAAGTFEIGKMNAAAITPAIDAAMNNGR